MYNVAVFIYSMPGYNCSIKERMLYSSCKGPFTDTIMSWGVDIVKKVSLKMFTLIFFNQNHYSWKSILVQS